jgi:hypothetical protein
MRKLIVSNLVTVDGFFEGPNQELDWFMPNEEFFDYVRILLNNASTILLEELPSTNGWLLAHAGTKNKTLRYPQDE